MNTATGVIWGEFDRVQSGLARISICTSFSHPSLTPSTFSDGKKEPFTGVWSTPQVDGGLLMVLPDVDRGGVVGNT